MKKEWMIKLIFGALFSLGAGDIFKSDMESVKAPGIRTLLEKLFADAEKLGLWRPLSSLLTIICFKATTIGLGLRDYYAPHHFPKLTFQNRYGWSWTGTMSPFDKMFPD